MDSLLNTQRPPVFCPGCSHEHITRALDRAFELLALPANRIAIVSDIGCSGLFDTFFNTHAMHGLHGRALTYATGIKLARPELSVVVTMGDGGLGIGGAHLLAACRRNLSLTLLILNNFNFGMTGGQFSATTPTEARVASGFLNRLERPMDVCQVAAAAGAAYVRRCSSYQKDLSEEIARAIAYDGFAVVDMWGICPGRYSRGNRLTPRAIAESLARLPPATGEIPVNARREYGTLYRETGAQLPEPPPAGIETSTAPPASGRHEVLLLGSAGQRIITAGELLCLAGMTAGLHATQKNDYNITVLRGPSISELILSETAIGYTGIGKPAVIVALSQEGADRRRAMFAGLDADTQIVQVAGVRLPPTAATLCPVDFKALGIKPADWALAALAVVAQTGTVIDPPMLAAALKVKFSGDVLAAAAAVIECAAAAAYSGGLPPVPPRK